jgi:hypothetical protein
VSWFRWKKRGEGAPEEAAAPETSVEQQPARRDSAEAAERKPGAPARRRRGSRGGRGRAKKKPEGTGTATAEKADVEEKKPQRKASSQQRERRRQQPSRRAAAPPKVELPDVAKEILVSVGVGEQTVAVLEDGKPAEVYLGRPERRSVAGNI